MTAELEIATWAWAVGVAAVFVAGPMALLLWLHIAINRRPDGNPAEFVARDRPEGLVVALCGDSITHGRVGGDWVDRLRRSHSDVTFINAGVNGELAWNLLQRLDSVEACKPDVIVVLIGANDAIAASDPAMAKNYQRGANQLPVLPTLQWSRAQLENLADATQEIAETWWCTIPPLGEAPDAAPGKVAREWNDAVRAVAGSVVLDLHAALLDVAGPAEAVEEYVGSPSSILGRVVADAFAHYVLGRSWDAIGASRGSRILTDGIHLTDRGAAVMAGLVSAQVDASIAARSQQQ